jgi:UDP-glucose 4-epimerase
MKRVLITGANSYIGTSFEKYATEQYASELSVKSIDMIDGSWRKKSFSDYDIIFHVAGLAHVDIGNISEDLKAKYYAVNTDLAIECAKKAKEDGVKQFVFMSSAIIYGDAAPYGKPKIITKTTEPDPANFYGDSKWQADKGVRELRSPNFVVTVLRPPMIYGKGSKGNYPILAKMAKTLPVFPDCDNQRSMLYIENLCEFLCQVIIRGAGGVYWPQNAEYSKTSDVVRYIARANKHKIVVSRAFNWVVELAAIFPFKKVSGLANKAFGNMSYDQAMSSCDFEYQKFSLQQSIKRTEQQ